MSWRVVSLRPLRGGGYGELFLGKRSDTGEPVVVKFLRDFALADARRTFAREVRILKRSLDGIVPLLFAEPDVSHPYYVMPYLPGGSLTSWAGRLSEGHLHNVAVEVAETLTRLHAIGIAHGDVKPDNILVSRDGHLQLADPLGNGLGCTVLFSENRGGTPGYWAPEVARGGPISQPGDVYSYGATLHHLARGIRPRDGQRLDRDLELLAVAADIHGVIAACCNVDARARPRMADVLRILNGERWIDIQAKRAEARQALTIGGGILAVCVLIACLSD